MILWASGNSGVLFVSGYAAALVLVMTAYLCRQIHRGAAAARAAALAAAILAVLALRPAYVLSWAGEARACRRVALEAAVCRVVNWGG